MDDTSIPSVTVVSLTHDLVRNRSVVGLVWLNDPEKRIALPVPYGCTLEAVRDEAEKALRALSAETASLAVKA